MLRMEFYEFPNYLKLRMEGRFVGEFAEHAKTLIGGPQLPSKLIVDLSEVNYVDAVGEEVLLWFKKMGVTFTTDSVYSNDVCERLELPIEREQRQTSHPGNGRREPTHSCTAKGEPAPIQFQRDTQI